MAQLLFSPLNPQTYPDDAGVTIQRVNNKLLALTETVMTVNYATRMTRSQGQWLDVLFLYDADHHDVKREMNDNASDDDNEKNERGKKDNQSIKSKTKAFRYNYDRSASYMHSASITEDYLILSEIPLHFSLFNTIRIILNGGLLTNMFKWNGSLPTYFRIISFDNGEEIARISGPPFFTFHHINAYQIDEADGNKVVIDICAYDDHRLVDELYLHKLRQNIFPSDLGYVRRFHLNLNTKQCTEPYENLQELSIDQQVAYPISHQNSLVPVQIDLPRINLNYIGKFYRYVYAVRGPLHYFAVTRAYLPIQIPFSLHGNFY